MFGAKAERTRCNPRAQLSDSRGGESFFASLTSAPLLGQGNPFALALMDEGPLEFGKGTHHPGATHEILFWLYRSLSAIRPGAGACSGHSKRLSYAWRAH